jgi:hypothetical protein
MMIRLSVVLVTVLMACGAASAPAIDAAPAEAGAVAQADVWLMCFRLENVAPQVIYGCIKANESGIIDDIVKNDFTRANKLCVAAGYEKAIDAHPLPFEPNEGERLCKEPCLLYQVNNPSQKKCVTPPA